MKSVVITGASGFLGGAVAKKLAESGFDVIPVSRKPLPGVRVVRDYDETPSGDFLIHCAEAADRPSVNAEGECYARQSAGLAATLSSRFGGNCIYASSGAVYGHDSDIPWKVESPVKGTDTYSSSKLENEKIFLAAGGSAVRLSNLIGTGMSRSNVVSEIIRQIPGRGPVTVRDDTPVRDFLPISDAAAVFQLLMQSSHRGIFNVGSGTGTSVRGLAETALAIAGESEREIVATHRSTGRSINVLDISETKRVLVWSPVTPLRTAIQQLLSAGVTA